MAPDANETPCFAGFPDFRANVTFTPIQFFTVVVPHCSRGTVRIVGYALRKVLGWVDEHGNPTREQLLLTYRELIEKAGVSRDSIADALRQALDRHCLRCVVPPHPNREGEAAQSGLFEICWDVEGAYTNRVEQFGGFYYPESAIIQDQAGAAPRPKAARKNIPNAFFDYLLPREPLSVIRVVAALLFYSIQWGPGGERRVPVRRSITELSRLTRLCRSRVHEAVMEARRRGYIELAAPGVFDPKAGKNSQVATYGVRWAADGATKGSQTATSPGRPTVGIHEPGGQRSEKANGESVEKGERERSENANGERSKKVNGVNSKIDPKTGEAAEQQGKILGAPAGEPRADADSGFQLLCQAGFDAATARRLVLERSDDVIRRQLAWLPLRTVNRSRLGLLRRAIEEDWPRPSGCAPSEKDSDLGAAARVFASHYYAAYHGFSGEARTEPFPKDLEVGGHFLSRLVAEENRPEKAPEWGRRFGQLMREAHRDDPRAKPNLSLALPLFGDRFLQKLRSETSARQTEAEGKARKAHQAAFSGAYLAFLQNTENRLRQAKPELYEAFADHREKLRRLMTSGPILVSAERLAEFQTEESRLFALADFFKKHLQARIPEFWEWDTRFNPRRFGTNSVSGAMQEAIQ